MIFVSFGYLKVFLRTLDTWITSYSPHTASNDMNLGIVHILDEILFSLFTTVFYFFLTSKTLPLFIYQVLLSPCSFMSKTVRRQYGRSPG